MNAIIEAIKRQPVRFSAACSIVINLAVSFGLNLSSEQVVMLNALIAAVLGWLIPGYVTPTAAPRLDAGTTVEVITPEGQPNKVVEL